MKVYLLWLSHDLYQAPELVDVFDTYRKAFAWAEATVDASFVIDIQNATHTWKNQALVNGVNEALVEEMKRIQEKKDRWEYERDGDFGYSYTNGQEHYYVQACNVK